MDYELLSGYQGIDKDQLIAALRRLLPYLDLNNIYFCGGIAIRYHLANNQKPISQRPTKDLDLCAITLDAVLPKVKGKFEVVDLQHLCGGYSFFLKLLDLEQDFIIDVFDNSFPARDPIKVQFENWMVNMRNAEDQLVKTVFDLQEVLKDGKIDTTPKQFEDARALWEIVDRQKAQKYWSESVQENPLFHGMPENLEEAMIKAENHVKAV